MIEHKTEDCDGHWIEITTLTDRFPLEKCTKCRAVRRRREDQIDQMDDEPSDRRAAPPPVYGDDAPAWIIALLVLAVGALCVLALALIRG